MSMTKDHQLIQDLQAPVKTFRIYALEEIIASGASGELLKALQIRLSDEEEEECRILLPHAVSAVKARLKLPPEPLADGPQSHTPSMTSWGQPPHRGDSPETHTPSMAFPGHTPHRGDRPPQEKGQTSQAQILPERAGHTKSASQRAPGPGIAEDLTADNFPILFDQGGVDERLSLLATFPRTLVTKLRDWVPGAFEREKHPAVAARLIKVFYAWWPLDRLEVLLKPVFEGYLSVRFAALEALIAIAPFRLVEHFPRLLQQDDARIHALAIRGLAKVDPEEAQNHLDQVLLGRDPSKKLAAIQVALFLPFETAKGPLLKFLVTEKDPGLIERAGLIFQTNPDPEIPYRLLEILKNSAPPKSLLIKETLEGVKAVIQHSGAIHEEFPVYFEKLQKSVEKRSALSLVQAAVTLLDSEDESERLEMEEILRENREMPQLREAIEDSRLPLSPATQERLESIFASETKLPETRVVAPDQFAGLSTVEKGRLLASCHPNDRGRAEALLSGLFTDSATPIELQVIAFRSANRLGIPGLGDAAQKRFNHSNDSLAVAALEYFASQFPEKIFSFLGPYLKGTRLRVRVAALRILGRQDPVQAITALTTMLRTTGPNSRKAALACLANFDFSLVREPLIDFLEQTKDASLLDFVLCLFQNNPHQENLFQLFRLEQTFSESLQAGIRKVRQENANLILSLSILDKQGLEKLESDLPEKYRAARQRIAAPAAYSVRVLRERQDALSLGWLSGWWDNMARFLVPGAAFVLLIGALIVFLPGADEPPQKVRSGGIVSVPFDVSATVTGFTRPGEEILLQTEDGAIFQLRRPGGAIALKVGDRVKAVVRPFRAIGGKIFARFESVERL